MKLPNVEVRISEAEGFHSKGWLFQKEEHFDFIVGSSNLTMNALKVNYEWNIRLSSYENGELLKKIRSHMEAEWLKAGDLTEDWIISYTLKWKPRLQTLVSLDEQAGSKIQPNDMQKPALKSLSELRAQREKRALVISATGTGKTYLSAFDVQAFQPKKMLFIVHREQILHQAKDAFQSVIGGADSDYGILSGSKKETEAKYLFATIQMMSRPEIHEQFASEHFDYILIDEVHKAGAKSYQTLIDYFKPNFLLGMTATPERMDDFNIYGLFDYNTAYEIRLKDAVEAGLLVPFHYFGVTDYVKDDAYITDTADLKELVAAERVKYLLEKIDYYGFQGKVAKGLVFCSRKEEARQMADAFSAQGLPSMALTGEDSMSLREENIRKLENGEISYLFTVDIFNEGIDIPSVNQIIMLRPTQSNIIFTQQLGRGLRKFEGKEFLTVIDFIGNYNNNYMIPMALSGRPSLTKDDLKKEFSDSSFISGLSAINFEEIAKERIYASISSVKLNGIKTLRESYFLLKERLGRQPLLGDYLEQKILEPSIFSERPYRNYQDFLLKIQENQGELTEAEDALLTMFSRELLPGFRQHELLILRLLLEKRELRFDELLAHFQQEGLSCDDLTLKSVLAVLSGDYYLARTVKIFGNVAFIDENEAEISRSQAFSKALENKYFIVLLEDLIKTAYALNKNFTKESDLTPFQKYERKDAIRLTNWSKEQNLLNVGGYIYNENDFLIFVTLDKGDDFKGAMIAYEDALLDQSSMLWYTKAPRTINSPEVQAIINNRELNLHIFANRDKDEKAFYYLGKAEARLDSIAETQKPTTEGKYKSIVHMELEFEEALDMKLFEYLKKS